MKNPPPRLPPLRLPRPSSARPSVRPCPPRACGDSWRSSWRRRCLRGSCRKESFGGRAWKVWMLMNLGKYNWFSFEPVLSLKQCLTVILCFWTGLFEMRAQDYLDSLPGSENRGVNKFLKGLGNVSPADLIKDSNQRIRACCFCCICISSVYIEYPDQSGWKLTLFLKYFKYNYIYHFFYTKYILLLEDIFWLYNNVW